MVSLHGSLFLLTRIYPCPELLLWGSTKANSCEMSQSVRGETVSSTPLNDLGCWPKSGFLWISHPSPHKNYKITRLITDVFIKCPSFSLGVLQIHPFCWTLNLWKDIWTSLWTPKPTKNTWENLGRSTGKKISVLQKDTGAEEFSIKHLSVGRIINLSKHHPVKVIHGQDSHIWRIGGYQRSSSFTLKDCPGWDSRQKTELKPSEWISFLRFAGRFPKSLGVNP